jgi:hypothetical protein
MKEATSCIVAFFELWKWYQQFDPNRIRRQLNLTHVENIDVEKGGRRLHEHL